MKEHIYPEEAKVIARARAIRMSHMEIICAWCGKYLGVKPAKNKGITHSICPECYDKILAE